MNRLLVLALGAPMALVGAAYPETVTGIGADPAAALEQEAARTYRPCRPGPGDDRCIQLYERGVRAAFARWQGERGGRVATQVAANVPADAAPARPQRLNYAARRPDRCAEPGHDQAAGHTTSRQEAPRVPERVPEAIGL